MRSTHTTPAPNARRNDQRRRALSVPDDLLVCLTFGFPDGSVNLAPKPPQQRRAARGIPQRAVSRGIPRGGFLFRAGGGL